MLPRVFSGMISYSPWKFMGFSLGGCMDVKTPTVFGLHSLFAPGDALHNMVRVYLLNDKILTVLGIFFSLLIIF